MTQVEYARHARVNPSTVARWLRSGRIEAEADGSIDPERADRMRWATESPLPHHQARKAQLDADKEDAALQLAASGPADGAPSQTAMDLPGGGGPGDGGDREQIGLALKRTTLALQQAKAEAAALDLDARTGAVVARGEVEFILADVGATLRGKLEGMSAQLAPVICGRAGNLEAIRADLDTWAREALHDLSATMERRAAAVLRDPLQERP